VTGLRKGASTVSNRRYRCRLWLWARGWRFPNRAYIDRSVASLHRLRPLLLVSLSQSGNINLPNWLVSTLHNIVSLFFGPGVSGCSRSRLGTKLVDVHLRRLVRGRHLLKLRPSDLRCIRPPSVGVLISAAPVRSTRANGQCATGNTGRLENGFGSNRRLRCGLKGRGTGGGR
jgi:hypothetical protein